MCLVQCCGGVTAVARGSENAGELPAPVSGDAATGGRAPSQGRWRPTVGGTGAEVDAGPAHQS
jgi:hypothetical protein